MCGTARYTGDDSDLTSKMLYTSKHCDPDDEGVFLYEDIALGHRGLSLSAFSQRDRRSIVIKNGNLVIIIHNGETYTYREFRDELVGKEYEFTYEIYRDVILYIYKEWVPKCVGEYNDLLGFIIYCRKKDILFMSRDRFGIMQLYYHVTADGRIILESEIKAILAYKTSWKLYNLVIFDYLRYNFSDYENLIFFKDKLPKGHNVIYYLEKSKFKIRNYWKIKHKKEVLDFEKITEENLLINSVKLRLKSDVLVCSWLPTGVNPPIIVSIIANNINNTYVINALYAVYSRFEKMGGNKNG